MRDAEMLADWVHDLDENIRESLQDLTAAELHWQPDPEGNSIAVTVWHVARWLDVLNVQGIKNQNADQELWHTRGWRDKTGYDPRGIGYRGLGAVTDYTQAEVAAIPKLNGAELTEYTNQSLSAFARELLATPENWLLTSTLFFGRERAPYGSIKSVVLGCLAHLGEIETLKSMQRRARSR